jgi:hypothetical protein
MRKIAPLIAVLALVTVFSGVASGQTALEVVPAEFRVDDVPIGQQVTLSVKLNITYHGSSPAEYEIRSILPLSLREGYENIPDPSWMTFSPSELTLQPGTTENVTIYLSVPNNEEYLGKKWEVWIDVSPKPTYVGGGASMGVELFSRVLISTSQTPPPPLWPILISVLLVLALVAGLGYAIRKKKI